MRRILLAGATGYLGKYVLSTLVKRKIQTRILVRNPNKLDHELLNNELVEVKKAEVTDPGTLVKCCEGVDTVISSIGITRQKDGLTYMDVDYQANLNLLNEAKRSEVRKFIYVSVLNGEKLKILKVCEAKEKFVTELKASGLAYCVIRPNGFFSDMTEFYKMAKSGRVYLFGKGNLKSNPIHGKDLAIECVDAIDGEFKEFNIGGPQVLTQNEIAEIACDAAHKKPSIVHLPDWIRRVILKAARVFMNDQKYGPIEFFMTVMAMDMIAPEYGRHTLKAYYDELK